MQDVEKFFIVVITIREIRGAWNGSFVFALMAKGCRVKIYGALSAETGSLNFCRELL